MVNAATAIDTGSVSVARNAQTTPTAVLPSDAGGAVAQSSSQSSSGTIVNLAEKLRYNSVEFSYRQDFGKIVLLRQEPETGEVVQQFPSEYYLQKYAQSERIARQSVDDAGEAAPAARAPARNADVQTSAPVAQAAPVSSNAVVASSAAPVSVGSGGSGGEVAPAAAPSAPALPSGGVGGSGVGSGVDITV